MPDTYNIDYQMIECSVGSAGLARNKGLGVAKGKYIWFVDGDDWLNGDKAFIDILNAFRDHPQVDTITFGFSSQGWFWETNEFLSRFVYSRKVIGDIKFVEDMPCEGFQFVRDVRKNQKRQAVMNYRFLSLLTLSKRGKCVEWKKLCKVIAVDFEELCINRYPIGKPKKRIIPQSFKREQRKALKFCGLEKETLTHVKLV